MDLLGGYDSNSDSSQEETPAVPKKAKLSAPAISKKGKRLLKLQAVLPEHIWNQLSGGAQADGELDSEEEEEEEDARRQKKKSSDALPHHQASQEISSFLCSLHDRLQIAR